MAKIWTIGHSTRSLDEFILTLESQRIEMLADVRRFPGSRRYPHFGSDALAASLKQHRIAYRHFEALGGRRRPSPDSPNTAWRNESFRGYADHMMTAEFSNAIAALLELASQFRTAIMCAELLWWRCHRALISDYLKVRGHHVVHIYAENKVEEHPFTSAAHVYLGKLSYAARRDAAEELRLDF